MIATPRHSMDGSRLSPDKLASLASLAVTPPSTSEYHTQAQANHTEKYPQGTLQPIPITISPASPDPEPHPARTSSEKSEKNDGGLSVKRSSSIDRDTSPSKKAHQMLKNRVHEGRAVITTISRKIGSGVAKSSSLKRSSSTPGQFFSRKYRHKPLVLTSTLR